MAFVYRDHEGFRPAARSKKQKRRRVSVLDLVSRATEEITANEDWLSECRSLIRGCAEPGTRYGVTCLGLGSLSELQNARVQLVFLQLALQYGLGVTGDRVTIFDPVFTHEDASYLRDHAGYIVLSAEPENYTAGPDTVAYMPHCDLSLFETFLRDNWTPDRISDIILVGNTLSDYADKLSTVYPCVAKLGSLDSLSSPVARLIAGSVPYLDSRPIPSPDLLYSAFSSISIQRVRGSAVLPEPDDHFWSVQS